MMDGDYTATIDRIVDGETAVVLVEADGNVIEQIDVAVEQLPDECDAGSVISVTICDNEVVNCLGVKPRGFFPQINC